MGKGRQPEFNPGTHLLEAEHSLPKVALWSPHIIHCKCKNIKVNKYSVIKTRFIHFGLTGGKCWGIVGSYYISVDEWRCRRWYWKQVLMMNRFKCGSQWRIGVSRRRLNIKVLDKRELGDKICFWLIFCLQTLLLLMFTLKQRDTLIKHMSHICWHMIHWIPGHPISVLWHLKKQ